MDHVGITGNPLDIKLYMSSRFFFFLSSEIEYSQLPSYDNDLKYCRIICRSVAKGDAEISGEPSSWCLNGPKVGT